MTKRKNVAELFQPTRWTVVLAAADTGLGQGHRVALTELCEAYWRPVFVYLRRKGYSLHDAEDLAQGFFLQLLEKKGYAVANPDRGRFRAFLMSALKNFLCNMHDRETATKREVVAQTTESPDSTDVDAEIRYLLDCLRAQ